MNTLTYLNNLRPAIPLSVEYPCNQMSNGELRRHMMQSAILINGEKVEPYEEMDYPVFSLVFFPNSKTRRCTLV